MKWFSILSLIFFISSCTIVRRIYTPLPVNNPSLKAKNDFSVSATYSEPNGLDINGGYAISNRLAIIAGGYTHKTGDIQHYWFNNVHDSSNLIYRDNGFTIGAGTYFPIADSKNFFSGFAGLSTGDFKMTEDFYAISPNASHFFYNYKSRLNRYFVQGSFNHYGGVLEISLNLKLNLVEYKNVTTDYSDNQLQNYYLPPFDARRINSFLDMGIDIKGYISQNPRIGIHYFAVGTNRLNNEELLVNGHGYYAYYGLRTGIGIIISKGSPKEKTNNH